MRRQGETVSSPVSPTGAPLQLGSSLKHSCLDVWGGKASQGPHSSQSCYACSGMTLCAPVGLQVPTASGYLNRCDWGCLCQENVPGELFLCVSFCVPLGYMGVCPTAPWYDFCVTSREDI